MIGITSSVVKEGDILVIEGGVPRHIIVPKKRTDVIAGAYAAAIMEHPNTVYVDAKEVSEEDLPNIEEIAKRKLIETIKANTRLLQEMSNGIDQSKAKSLQQEMTNGNKGSEDATSNQAGNMKSANANIKTAEKKENKENKGREESIVKVNAKVLSLSEPESGPESEPVIVAEVEGLKGKFKVFAKGKHAERLIALEGQTACLWMSKRFDKKYNAYEVEEVHFSMKRAVVDTKVSCIDGNYTAEAKEGNQVNITAFDIETIQKLEEAANTEQKVRLVLEYSEVAHGSFVVTDVLPAGGMMEGNASGRKAS